MLDSGAKLGNALDRVGTAQGTRGPFILSSDFSDWETIPSSQIQYSVVVGLKCSADRINWDRSIHFNNFGSTYACQAQCTSSGSRQLISQFIRHWMAVQKPSFKLLRNLESLTS